MCSPADSYSTTNNNRHNPALQKSSLWRLCLVTAFVSELCVGCVVSFDSSVGFGCLCCGEVCVTNHHDSQTDRQTKWITHRYGDHGVVRLPFSLLIRAELCSRLLRFYITDDQHAGLQRERERDVWIKENTSEHIHLLTHDLTIS